MEAFLLPVCGCLVLGVLALMRESSFAEKWFARHHPRIHALRELMKKAD
jgi:hypothetical protein